MRIVWRHKRIIKMGVVVVSNWCWNLFINIFKCMDADHTRCRLCESVLFWHIDWPLRLICAHTAQKHRSSKINSEIYIVVCMLVGLAAWLVESLRCIVLLILSVFFLSFLNFVNTISSFFLYLRINRLCVLFFRMCVRMCCFTQRI